jgi:PLAT/LH2 domain
MYFLLLTVPLLLGTGGALRTPTAGDRVWRAQLKTHVCDHKHADTNNDVRVRLSSSNTTWLDYGRNDFERNDTFTYDLNLGGITTFSDITGLRINKTGDNGMCLDLIELRINGKAVFRSTSRKWFDNEGSYTRSFTVSRAGLEASPDWQAYAQPIPSTVMSNDEIESRVEGLIGDKLREPGQEDVHWGDISGEAVSVKKKSPHVLKADLDLRARIPHFPDQTVDVDFDIQFQCSNNAVEVTATNFDVDVETGRFTDLVLGFLEFFHVDVLRSLGKGFNSLTLTAGSVPRCPSDLIATDDGGIKAVL